MGNILTLRQLSKCLKALLHFLRRKCTIFMNTTTVCLVVIRLRALSERYCQRTAVFYVGKMERFYNDLVLCHRDGVQTEVRLNEVQQQMLTGLQKPLGGSALATFELDLDYLTDLRSVVETQLSMAIRLG